MIVTKRTCKNGAPAIAALLAALLALCACTRQGRRPFPTLSAQAGRVCDSLDVLYRSDRIHQGRPLLARLERLTDPWSGGDRACVLYWKCLVEAGADSTMAWLREALALTDSARNPCLYARLLVVRTSIDKSNFLRRYEELRNSAEYFAQARDTLMEMMTYRRLAALHFRIGDVGGFIRAVDMVDSLCRLASLDTLLAKNSLNRAIGHLACGDTARARRILHGLERNPLVASDPDFRGKVLLNLGILYDSPHYMRRALETSPAFRASAEQRAYIKLGMMKAYDRLGDVRRADSLYRVLAPLVRAGGDQRDRMTLHDMASRRARRRGDLAGALAELEMARALQDSVFTAADVEKVASSGLRSQLAAYERTRLWERELNRYRVWGTAALALCVAALALLLLRSRHNRMVAMRKALEADMARSALRLERERHNVQSMTIAMKERDGLMDEIRQHLAAMCDDGSISRSAWDSIERKMRMSELTRREWDELQEMYARTHPHFFDLLRARYPALTDGDVWLAFYISAGLASKDIARVTHLQPNSIKKNRQRLRRRMGIASEVSLEEVLRSIRSEPPAQGKGPEPASADSGPLKGTCAVSGGTP